jgi:hypothetical protein
MPRGLRQAKSHNQIIEEICKEIEGAARYNSGGRQCVVKTVNGQTYWIDFYPNRKDPYHLAVKDREGNWQSYNYTSRKAVVSAVLNGRRIYGRA